MGKIMDIKTIRHGYEEEFSNQVMREVNKMQERGWYVEVQYSTTSQGNLHSFKHSAMIIGKI
ncbi:hypothetical protein [Bacillus phage vB_BanS-Thrax3]|nr:hypothetical protein [Bacillus phage vB_BanS-Thrax3]